MMFWLLSSLLLVSLVSGSHPPIYNPSSHFSNPSSRVVNGVPVNPTNKYPWQVALLFEENGYLYFLCGGTLIKRNWVMTAAHCFPYDAQYWVMLGAYNLYSLSGSEQFIPAAEIIKHPKYDDNDASLGNDIALIRLSECAVLTNHVQLGCLPPAGYITRHWTSCYVTGWGATSTDGPASDVLLEGLLCAFDHEHCSQQEFWGNDVKPFQLCAGECGASACYGDSGGPLNCPGVTCPWEVDGIVSFGSYLGCNAPTKPTVFTRVSYFIDWIEEITSRYLSCR